MGEPQRRCADRPARRGDEDERVPSLRCERGREHLPLDRNGDEERGARSLRSAPVRQRKHRLRLRQDRPRGGEPLSRASQARSVRFRAFPMDGTARTATNGRYSSRCPEAQKFPPARPASPSRAALPLLTSTPSPATMALATPITAIGETSTCRPSAFRGPTTSRPSTSAWKTPRRVAIRPNRSRCVCIPTTGAFPTGTRTQVASVNVNVANQAGTILNVPISTAFDSSKPLVVEVFTPDGEAPGNLFFIGSNASSETGPSYISASACGSTHR